MKKLILSFLLLFPLLSIVSNAETKFDIQKTIDSLGKNGGTVEIPSGTYNISKSIVITKPNVILKGQGNSTVLVGAKSDTSIIVVKGSESTATTILNDLKPGGGLDYQNPVLQVADSRNLRVGDQVKIVQGTSKKFSYNYIRSIDGNNVTLVDNITEKYEAAKKLKLIKVSLLPDVTIQDMSFTSLAKVSGEPQHAAIRGMYTDRLKIENVNFTKVTATPIFIDQSLTPSITGNSFIQSGRVEKGDYAIGSQANFAAKIMDNTITQSGPINITNNQYTKVINNYANDTGPTNNDAITVDGGIENLISYNTILRPNCYGIWLLGGAERNTISNNQFIAGITSGVYLTDAKNNIIENNVARYNSGNGIFLDFGADRNMVRNNSVYENESRGILVHGINNKLLGNISEDNAMEQFRIATGNSLDNVPTVLEE
ncbi:right-handed parallel beta-helix repeat-containing protein [Cohnella sp. GCM10027633]|uniref:right-handed parallel beta-helix repeat-containing protein n=1 Tax=unclassified Cohnella TaxID=2636738 RepID=UPI0036331F79